MNESGLFWVLPTDTKLHERMANNDKLAESVESFKANKLIFQNSVNYIVSLLFALGYYV